MELETIFSRFNPWWEEEFKIPGIPREHYLQLLLKEVEKSGITFVTGLRRVGKTTLLKQIIGTLLENGLDRKRILFLSLDHPALGKISILELVEKYRQMFNLSSKEKLYLFFDEVQYLDNFEQDLKILHDHESVKVFASGSNSLVLRDKKAFLTGRNNNVIVNPLNFEEFLLFKGIKVRESDQHLLQNHFENYLEQGGLPEYVLTNDPEKVTSLINNIIYKDIVGKHGIKNATKIEELFILLCERVGKRLTYNKLSHILGLDVETVSSYVSFFEETFLIYRVSRYAKSTNEKVRSPKKIYIADTGIRSVLVGFKDKGALWENLVFLKLRGKKVSYFYEQDQEIDFILELPKRKIAIEAKYQGMNEDEAKKVLEKSRFKEKILAKDWRDFKKLDLMLGRKVKFEGGRVLK